MVNKKITEAEINAIRENLVSTKSPNRRSAAKKIRKYNLTKLGDELYNAYLKEKADKRTWETQTEMIQTLGKIGYKKVLSEILPIVEKNEKLDMITFAAALSFVRLERTNCRDIRPIMELLEFGELSVLCGAMASLTFDDVIPTKDDISLIIQKMESFEEGRIYVTGVHDPRGYLISAMALWNKELTSDYLQKYKNHKSLKYNVERAFLNKKSCFES
uniref:HEAT repeat domain-containing protein n=2 Tax=unclassified Prevotella TaxID=2638335 RepID=A0AB33J5E4_9BACT